MATQTPPYRRQDVSDPYLHGSFRHGAKAVCQICGAGALCIRIAGVDLPKQIDPTCTILWLGPTRFFTQLIGINCGCYAKFHRQIAHIITNMNIRHRNEPDWEKIPTP